MEDASGSVFSNVKKSAWQRRNKSKENNSEDAKNAMDLFSVPDDLSLKLTDIDESAAELMNFDAQDQRHDEMKDENIRLKKVLSEKDFEIKLLKKKCSENELQSGANLAADVAATKIVELSRKIRDLTAELESERTRNKQLNKTIHDLENTAVVKDDDKTHSANKSNENETAYSDVLQEKLNLANSRLAEYRNNCQILKKDLKVAHKALAQEIGDSNSVQSALGGIGWRGRAQQIMSLQNKVAELKSQLDKEKEKHQDADAKCVEQINQSQNVNYNDKQKEQIKKMEKERREDKEKMLSDLKSVEKDLQKMREKYEGSKARIHILNGENQKLKAKTSALITKGEHDDELIKAFSDQVSKFQETQQQLNSLKITETEIDKIRLQHQEEIEKLKRIINDREDQILNLQRENEYIKQNMPESRRSRNSFSHAPNSAPNSSRSPLMSVEEIRNGILPQLTSNGDDYENKIFELQTMCCEYRIVSQAAQVEKEKLMELVNVLNKRVEEATTQVVQAQQHLHEIQLKNVQLEKQKEKANLESAKGGGTTNRRTSLPPTRSSIYEGNSVTELRNSVQTLKEEKEELQNALQNILKAKEDDLKVYQDIIAHAQQIFVEALHRNEFVETAD